MDSVGPFDSPAKTIGKTLSRSIDRFNAFFDQGLAQCTDQVGWLAHSTSPVMSAGLPAGAGADDVVPVTLGKFDIALVGRLGPHRVVHRRGNEDWGGCAVDGAEDQGDDRIGWAMDDVTEGVHGAWGDQRRIAPVGQGNMLWV